MNIDKIDNGYLINGYDNDGDNYEGYTHYCATTKEVVEFLDKKWKEEVKVNE